jgi:hypothetical protein
MLLLRKNPLRFVTAKNVQRFVTALVLLAALCMIAVAAKNYLLLQRPLDRVMARDARNFGVRTTVYFDSFFDVGSIVFDVRAVGPPGGQAGLLRTFLQFAHEMQGRDVSEVIIAFQGHKKYKMHGDDFLGLGALVGATQPRQLIWELAHNLRFLNNKLVITNLSGDYATLLQQSLGGGSETKTADQLYHAITQ